MGQNNINNHIEKYNYNISIYDRNKRNKHNSFVVWFTGLSGAGKSTLANDLESLLYSKGINTYVLDGDNVRKGINNDLQFSPKDRKENIRRVAEISNLFVDAGVVVLATFISPYKKDREFVANTVGRNNFIEIFVNTSLQECEKRDVKGLYKKALNGRIKNFTGISAPYETPEFPDLELTEKDSLTISIGKILKLIEIKLY